MWYEVSDMCNSSKFFAESDEDALDIAHEWLSQGTDPDSILQTTKLCAEVRCLGEDRDCDDDGEVVGDVIRIVEPEEPECLCDDGHDWESLGCCGKGGGVITKEYCHYCGCGKTTDTWADDRFGGHMDSVSYVPDEYLDHISDVSHLVDY